MTTTAVAVEDADGRARLPHHRAQAVDQQRHHRRCLHDPRHGARRARRGSSSSGAPRASPRAPPEDKHGIRLSNTAALFLDDVVVPATNLVGGVEGRGLVQAQQVFGYTRVMVAAFGLGGGWEAIDRAIRYSTQRVQGGAPLSEKQGYTHKLIVPHVVASGGRPRLRRGDGDPDRRRRGRGRCAQHRGRDREVPRDRGGCRRGRRGDPGPRRLRLHASVPRREDPPRRPDHHDLRGHLRDHGDDHRAGPLAAAPQDPWRATTSTPPTRARALHASHPTVGADVAGARPGVPGRGARGLPGRPPHPQPARAAAARRADRPRRVGGRARPPRRRRRRGIAAREGRPEVRRRRPGRDQPRLRPRRRAQGRRGRACAGSAGAADPGAAGQLVAGLPLDAVRAAQAGLLADMDAVADVIYDRVTH